MSFKAFATGFLQQENARTAEIDKRNTEKADKLEAALLEARISGQEEIRKKWEAKNVGWDAIDSQLKLNDTKGAMNTYMTMNNIPGGIDTYMQNVYGTPKDDADKMGFKLKPEHDKRLRTMLEQQLVTFRNTEAPTYKLMTQEELKYQRGVDRSAFSSFVRDGLGLRPDYTDIPETPYASAVMQFDKLQQERANAEARLNEKSKKIQADLSEMFSVTKATLDPKDAKSSSPTSFNVENVKDKSLLTKNGYNPNAKKISVDKASQQGFIVELMKAGGLESEMEKPELLSGTKREAVKSHIEAIINNPSTTSVDLLNQYEVARELDEAAKDKLLNLIVAEADDIGIDTTNPDMTDLRDITDRIIKRVNPNWYNWFRRDDFTLDPEEPPMLLNESSTLAPNEVIRYKDGRAIVYDKNTRKALRYAD